MMNRREWLKAGALAPADFMADLCVKNGMVMRGHTQTWHSQPWPWLKTVVNQQNARQHLEDHIRTVAGRYKDRMHSWDVVNEAVLPTDGREGTAEDRLTGDARSGLHRDGVPSRAGSRPECDALLQLLERKAPLHAFGMQAHLNAANQESINAETLRRFFGAGGRRGADLGPDRPLHLAGEPEPPAERDALACAAARPRIPRTPAWRAMARTFDSRKA